MKKKKDNIVITNTNMRKEIIGEKAEEILKKVYKDKKLRRWLRQFIYFPHGKVVGRIDARKITLCDGCEHDIDTIIEEIVLVTLGKLKIGKKDSPYKSRK